MGWTNLTYGIGQKLLFPLSFLDKFSWASCPTASNRSSTKLGKEEIAANQSATSQDIEEIVVTGTRLRSSVSEVGFTAKQETSGGSYGIGGLGPVEQIRHLFETEGNGKDGAFIGDKVKNVYLTNDFDVNIGFAWKVGDDGYAARTLLASKLKISQYYAIEGLSTGDIVTLDGGVTDGLLEVRIADGSVATETPLGVALEDISSSGALAVSVGDYTMAEYLSGGSPGDPVYVSAAGKLDLTPGTNLWGRISINPSSALQLGLHYRLYEE